MISGYVLVDRFIEARTDLFSLGNSALILELNNVVLYGPDTPTRHERYHGELQASEKYFYNRKEGDFGDFMEFYQRSLSRDVWSLGALVYLHLQARPQLFIEGNHRTGALLMSYLLLRAGKPPFVLNRRNVIPFFEVASAIGRHHKHSLSMLFRGRRLRRQLESVLKDAADTRHLLPANSKPGVQIAAENCAVCRSRSDG